MFGIKLMVKTACFVPVLWLHNPATVTQFLFTDTKLLEVGYCIVYQTDLSRK